MNKITNSHMIAKMIDHSLLAPYLNDAELEKGCEIAKKWDVASVCIKPYHVPLARKLLEGTDVLVGAVIAFPHGNSTIETKVFECKDVLAMGAQEVDMVVNIGKVVDEDWEYVEREIGSIVALTKEAGAALKVIFENDMLHGNDALKIQLCKICSKLKVDFVKTSTGYCFNKGADGKWTYEGATEHDLTLMRKYSDPDVQVKAAGNVGMLDTMIHLYEDIGVTRVGTARTEEIMRAALERFGK